MRPRNAQLWNGFLLVVTRFHMYECDLWLYSNLINFVNIHFCPFHCFRVFPSVLTETEKKREKEKEHFQRWANSNRCNGHISYSKWSVLFMIMCECESSVCGQDTNKWFKMKTFRPYFLVYSIYNDYILAWWSPMPFNHFKCTCFS